MHPHEVSNEGIEPNRKLDHRINRNRTVYMNPYLLVFDVCLFKKTTNQTAGV